MGIKERRQAEKDARVNLIAESARAVFKKRGFQATTINEIAARAQVSPGIIYHYFKSKSDLFFCLVQPALENLIRDLTKVAKDKSDSPDKKLFRLAQVIYQFYLNHNDTYNLLIRYNDDEYSRQLPEERLVHFKRMMRETMRLCEVVIQEGIDRKMFDNVNPYGGATIFLGAFMGMMQFQENRMKQPGKGDHREESLQYLQIIINGLKKK